MGVGGVATVVSSVSVLAPISHQSRVDFYVIKYMCTFARESNVCVCVCMHA